MAGVGNLCLTVIMILALMNHSCKARDFAAETDFIREFTNNSDIYLQEPYKDYIQFSKEEWVHIQRFMLDSQAFSSRCSDPEPQTYEYNVAPKDSHQAFTKIFVAHSQCHGMNGFLEVFLRRSKNDETRVYILQNHEKIFLLFHLQVEDSVTIS